MQPIRLFLRRVFSGKTAAGNPWTMTQPQAFLQSTKSSDRTSQVSNTHAPELDENEIDPNNKDTWSRGPDLLWLHSTQDKRRKMLKAKYEQKCPVVGTHRVYLDLPEGRVHIARYFP